MSATDPGPDEAVTKEELEAQPPAQPPPKRNAFLELMKPKPKAAVADTLSSSGAYSRGNPFRNRDALGAYLADPSAFSSSRVIYYNSDVVVIHDLYPKASIHTLLLPRSAKHSLLHPFDAFDDPVFLATVQGEVLKLRSLVANELRRRFGQDSESDARRQAVLNGDAESQGAELPAGRDWDEEIISGIHAHPSMSHLHVHVLSRDMFSDCMKHRKHYNSFNTPFLIDVADFPLARDDPRRQPGKEGWLSKDLECWRCGENFGNKFKSLKDHLAGEFAEWKRE